MSTTSRDTQVPHDDVRYRAVGFFRLLKAFAQSRQSVIRQVDEYADHLWFCDIPDSYDCYTRAKGASEDYPDDIWVEVKQRSEPKCPSPSNIVTKWLKSSLPFGSNPDDEPELFEKIPLMEDKEASDDGERGSEPAEPKYEFLNDHPDVAAAWDVYLLDAWLPWTEKHQNWQKHHAVYARLFSIHQAQLREGERFELVLGLGCLAWITPTDQRIVRHLLTVPAVLEFDADQGIFSVRPSHDGIRVALELDMLEYEERPADQLERMLRGAFTTLEEDLWNRETLDGALRSIAKTLDDRGEYDDSIGPIPRLSKAPLVMFAPAIIYRRRSARGMVEAFSNIVEQLEGGGDIPPNIRKLSESSPSSSTGDATTETVCTTNEDSEVYFPLPSNREQHSIVSKLRDNTGLLVQGPPGTGKSHTIANLVSHLLATGRRVLITAQTPQALSVLKDKVPVEIQALCVSALGHDRESIAHLEASVRGIANREATWDESRAQEEVTNYRTTLARLREQAAIVDRELESMRRAETEKQEIGGGKYSGTAKDVALRVRSEEEGFNWLRDDIAADEELPVDAPSVREALVGLRTISTERAGELTRSWPDGDVLDTGKLVQLFRRERSYEEKRESLRSPDRKAIYEAIVRSGAARKDIQLLDNAVKDLRQATVSIKNAHRKWVQRARTDVLSGNARAWQELRRVTDGKVNGLAHRVRCIGEQQFVIPENCEQAKLQADAIDLKQYLENGGTLGLISRHFNATAKRTNYIASTVTVDGRPCDNVAALASLIEWIDLERTTTFLWQMWKGFEERGEGHLSLQIALIEELLETLDGVLSLGGKIAAAKSAVSGIRGLSEAAWEDSTSVDALFDACQAVIATILSTDVQAEIARIASEVGNHVHRDDAHPICGDLVQAINQRSEEQLNELAAKIRNLVHDKAVRDRCMQVVNALAVKAPRFAQDLRTSASEPIWDERILVLELAWSWARARSWMKSFVAGQGVDNLLQKFERLNKEIATVVERLATTKAWSHCIGRLTESHQQNLVAWQQAIRRIGGGTGRHAERHRREAQKHLAVCQEAIPAWVMPMYRLYETIDPRPGMFDVVIVDEASQCGLDGLLLNYIGQQVVIVGDDEQISPTRITDHDNFLYLVKQFLPDYHLSSVIQPETSLFDLGEVWFRNRIVLREHFRCMPEIIRFSNDLCYSHTPLLPLRQYSANRLPPVKSVLVSGGCEEGAGQRRTNPREGRALVDAIVACCHDPRYDGKTMGVVSLLGDSQARLIENELIDRLGPETIEKRKLLCGDAYSFQGDERDVMFLSLVVSAITSNGDRSLPRALTAKQFKQRYNVAASRARDQMWLFHSVTLEELRNPEDLRRKLVEHCLNPGKPAEEVCGIKLDELRYLASRSERPLGTQPAPFESWFEIDVYLRIHDEGYRVVPQYPTLIGNYRIDLVVEGNKTRLAIECDGDHWHGPEQFHADIERQRQLERAGWSFWRVWSSEYYFNPAGVLETLWRRLKQLEILPYTQETAAVDEHNGESTISGDDDNLSSAPLRDAAENGDGEFQHSKRTSDDLFALEDDPVSTSNGSGRGVPYAHWQPRALEHPDDCSINDIAAVLAEIVQTEGPMVDDRAFKLYARAAGIQRLRRPVREKLDKALDKAGRDGLVERRKECGMNVVWTAGRPDVIVRVRGNRPLQEVPPSEIAELMREILKENLQIEDDALVERLRNDLSIGRLTQVTGIFLSKIRDQLVTCKAVDV